MLFVRHPDLLKRLVSVLLGISIESITQFQTINTEMPPEEIGRKFCRLDIHMVVDGKQVNLEIQVEEEELEKLVSCGGEVMNQAVEAYRGITAEEKFQYLEILRARAKHDEAQALNNARRQRDAHWQVIVAEKDTALAEQAALIAQLQAQINQK